MKKFALSAVVAAIVLPAAAMAAGTPGSNAVLTGISHSTASSGPSALDVSYITVDVTGTPSWNAVGDAANIVINLPVAAGASLLYVGWNVGLEAYSPSWLSEIGVQFSDSAVSSTAVWLRPGAGVNSSGTGSYSSAPVDLTAAGLAFPVGADGILRLEFFESFDDGTDFQDGNWVTGTLTIGVSAVPEVGTYGLMAVGLVGVALAARRRRAI